MSVVSDRERHIRDIQTALNQRGCYDGAIDGLVGQGTVEAFETLSVMNRGYDIGNDVVSSNLASIQSAPKPCINISTVFTSSARYKCLSNQNPFRFDLYFIPDGILFKREEIEFKFDRDVAYKYYNDIINPYFGFFEIDNGVIKASVTFWEIDETPNALEFEIDEFGRRLEGRFWIEERTYYWNDMDFGIKYDLVCYFYEYISPVEIDLGWELRSR